MALALQCNDCTSPFHLREYMKHLLTFLMATLFMNTANANLPQGFVYLHEVDPSILVQMRYLSDQNFIGKPLNGYKKPVVILTREAAEALAKLQQDVKKDGYTVVVYDAFRPQKTVDQFVAWGDDINDNKMKALYYPRVAKHDVFRLQYVAEKSTHTRGSTVDLSLLPAGQTLKDIKDITPVKRTLADGFEVFFLDDGTLDMGTSFDLFDEASHPASQLVAQNYQKNRQYLQDKMQQYGFEGVETEWWHFTFKNEPFPDTYFDFDIE